MQQYDQQEPSRVTLSPAQLFQFADDARDAGDFETAETAYRALASNPDIELRTEARFRLALMLDRQTGRTRDAAVLLREILDEKPDAARVRVELARMQAQLGKLRSAERELRAAQASGLPPEVERLVGFYVGALNSRRVYGANFELALAPDSNVNRATRSDTLGTVIGDFDLSEDAQAQSGLGLSTRAQLWGRLPVSGSLNLRAEFNGNGSFYRDGKFDDYSAGVEVGPQWRWGRDRFSLAGVVHNRWFGGEPYVFSYGAEASYRHPIDGRSQLSGTASLLLSEDDLNNLRDAERFGASLGADRAFSSRFGGGVQLNGQRNNARDPGYATTSGGLTGYLYREFRETTLVANAGYSHLEADARLFLYPERRRDDRFQTGISGTFRSLRIGSFAPIVRVQFERNWSTVEIYDYRRISADIGVTAAF